MLRSKKERLPVPHPALYKFGLTKLAPVVLRDYGGLIHANTERLDEIEGSYILAPVHRSWWDIPAVGLSAYRHDKTQVHFMAKSEFWDKKLHGKVLTATGAFPIVRGDAQLSPETVAHMGALAKNNAAICAFPEGGIKSGELQRRSIKRGIAALAIYHSLPIVPVGIVGIAEQFADGWPIAVSFGTPIPVEQQDLDFSNPRTIVGPASALRDSLFEGMQQAQAEARVLQKSV